MGLYPPTTHHEAVFPRSFRDLQMSVSQGWQDYATTHPRPMRCARTIQSHLLNRGVRVDRRDREHGRVIRTAPQFCYIRRSFAPECIPNGRESSPCRVIDQSRRRENHYPFWFTETLEILPLPRA